jgi:hypothetical protein
MSQTEHVHHESFDPLPEPGDFVVTIDSHTNEVVPDPRPTYKNTSDLGSLASTEPAYHGTYTERETAYHDPFETTLRAYQAESSTRARERSAQIAETLEQDGTVYIANGFSFVVDRRPPGQENTDIPGDEFTQYFANDQIPFAASSDRKQHSHDKGHAASYEEMFQAGEMAEMVRAAATNSLASRELCSEFTGAMDGYGDSHRNLVHGIGLQSSVNGSQFYMLRLVKLAMPDATLDQQCQKRDSLLKQLGWDYYNDILQTLQSYRNEQPYASA